jgi:hypothetical protein
MSDVEHDVVGAPMLDKGAQLVFEIFRLLTGEAGYSVVTIEPLGLASASAFETLSCAATGEAKSSARIAVGKFNAAPAGDLKANPRCCFGGRKFIASHQSGPERAWKFKPSVTT